MTDITASYNGFCTCGEKKRNVLRDICEIVAKMSRSTVIRVPNLHRPRNENSTRRLFLISAFTNPLVMFFVSFYAMIIPLSAVILVFNLEDYNQGTILIISVITGSFLYMFLTLMFSRLVGKWLKAPNRSLVTFVYLMFGVVFSVITRGYSTETLEASLSAFVLSIAILIRSSCCYPHIMV